MTKKQRAQAAPGRRKDCSTLVLNEGAEDSAVSAFTFWESSWRLILVWSPTDELIFNTNHVSIKRINLSLEL